tara:strand:+ start:2582 stop:3247 length:666 start_codon:yes stop_codon:yes gene_type:complete
MKKKILITGCKGQIGSFLCKKLSKNYNILKIDKEFDTENNLILSNLMSQKIYAIIFAHGYNSTPLFRSKKKEILNEDEILKYFNINFFLNLKIIKYYLKKNKTGRIINFSSIYSINSPKHFIYKNFTKEIGYSVSKAASNMMMKYLGTKFGKKFLFNSIILGGVKNKGLNNFFKKNYIKNTPMGRMIELKEILPLVNFLLDEENKHTNAQNIPLDGGWLSW